MATGLGASGGREPSEPAEPGFAGGGHHADGEIYDEERTVLLTGEVESFLFGNPHSLLHARVADDGSGRAFGRGMTREQSREVAQA